MWLDWVITGMTLECSAEPVDEVRAWVGAGMRVDERVLNWSLGIFFWGGGVKNLDLLVWYCYAIFCKQMFIWNFRKKRANNRG